MLELFSGVFSNLISKGLETWSEAKETELLRAAIRSRLHREVKLNLEIWKLVRKEAENVVLADLVSSDAFSEICSLNLPLDALLGRDPLPLEVFQLLQQYQNTSANQNYINWAKEIQTEIDLIERIWHRLRVLKVRKELNGSMGDTGYLFHLHAALEICLRLRMAVSLPK